MLKLIDVTWLYQHLPMRFTLSSNRASRSPCLGPAGPGKSTLLNLIAGFLSPASGVIMIENSDHTRTPPSRRPVSMLFQENNLFTHLTAKYWSGAEPGPKTVHAQNTKLEAIACTMGWIRCLAACRISFLAASVSAWRWPVVCVNNPCSAG
jgi:thiamine transport system ATP-binding protein